MGMRRLLLPILIVSAFPAVAQRMLSVEEAIATTLQNNYDIRLARNDSLVASLNYSYGNAAFYGI